MFRSFVVAMIVLCSSALILCLIGWLLAPREQVAAPAYRGARIDAAAHWNNAVPIAVLIIAMMIFAAALITWSRDRRAHEFSLQPRPVAASRVVVQGAGGGASELPSGAAASLRFANAVRP